MKKHSRITRKITHQSPRFVSFLVAVLLLFGAVSVLNFSVFAENEDVSFDSFALHEEYQALAESFDLNTRLQERKNFDSEYEPCYEDMIVEYTAKRSFDKTLEEGDVVFRDKDFDDHPTLYVPMIDTATSQVVTYAQIVVSCNGSNDYGVFWHDSRTEIITEETLNAQLDTTSSYVLIKFEYGLSLGSFVYAYETGNFYRCSWRCIILDDGKCYTVDDLLDYNDDARRKDQKRIWSPFVQGALILVGIVIAFIFGLTLTVIGAIALIRFLRRKKKKALQEKTPSSDV